jgi:uncharacterized membrane protein
VGSSAQGESKRNGSQLFEQLGAVQRALISGSVGILVAGSLAAFSPWESTVLLGWDAALVVLLSLIWIAVLKMTPSQTAGHALREDPSQALAGSMIIGAGIASLGAVGLILVKASNATGGDRAFLIVVGTMSVLLSWAVLHTVFTLRYARIYYSGTEGGIDFNEEMSPNYVDFAYLALTIGMTFQVSDTNLTSQAIRRTALRHALISYLFGAVIIGVIINIVGSLLH